MGRKKTQTMHRSPAESMSEAIHPQHKVSHKSAADPHVHTEKDSSSI